MLASLTLSTSLPGAFPSTSSPTKQARPARKPYTGQNKAVVIAIDVGTLFSGVSYALLDPGKIPEIHEVTK